MTLGGVPPFFVINHGLVMFSLIRGWHDPKLEKWRSPSTAQCFCICRRSASVAACSKASRASPSMASLRWICWGSSELGRFLRLYSWVVRCFLTQCNHTQCIQRVYTLFGLTRVLSPWGDLNIFDKPLALFVGQPLIVVSRAHRGIGGDEHPFARGCC